MLRLGHGLRNGSVGSPQPNRVPANRSVYSNRDEAIVSLKSLFDDVTHQINDKRNVDDSLLAVRDSVHYVLNRLINGASFDDVKDVLAFIKDSTGISLKGSFENIYKNVAEPLKSKPNIPETPVVSIGESKNKLGVILKNLITIEPINTTSKLEAFSGRKSHLPKSVSFSPKVVLRDYLSKRSLQPRAQSASELSNVYSKRTINAVVNDISNVVDVASTSVDDFRQSPQAFSRKMLSEVVPVSALRDVKGDGHCFYRAVAVNTIENGHWNSIKNELSPLVNGQPGLKYALEQVDLAVSLSHDGVDEAVPKVFLDDMVDIPIMNAMRVRVQSEMNIDIDIDIDSNGEVESFNIEDNRKSPISVTRFSLTERADLMLSKSDEGVPSYAEGEDFLYTAKAFKLNLDVLNLDTAKLRRERLQVDAFSLKESVLSRYKYGEPDSVPVTVYFRTDHYQIAYPLVT